MSAALRKAAARWRCRCLTPLLARTESALDRQMARALGSVSGAFSCGNGCGNVERDKTMTRQMTGAKMVVQALKDQGVDVIFGYPGGAVLPIYDEIFQQNDIQHILVRHEGRRACCRRLCTLNR